MLIFAALKFTVDRNIPGRGPEAGRASRFIQPLSLLLHIPDTTYGQEFHDVGDERTTLGDGTFQWLVSIRASHLVFRCRDDCYLKPYLPCRSARQFGTTNYMLVTPTLSSGVLKV